MTPEQGELVLLPFPFTDLSTSKRRPAIVVSPDNLNGSTEDRIVVAVTSNPQAVSGAGTLPIATADLARGRLARPSVILPSKIFTIHRTLIVKTLGRLRASVLQSLLARLRDLFR